MEKVSVDKIIEVLEEVNDQIDYRTETALVDDGHLTSLDVVMVLSAVEEEFDVSIPAKDIVPENFNSAASLCELVERLSD